MGSSFYDSFTILSEKFETFHRDPTNVFLHFLTTPLGLIGFVGLLRYLLSHNLVALLSVFYIVSLVSIVNVDIYIGSLLLWGIIVVFAFRLKLRPVYCIIFILIGYFGQDLSHYLTGEKTFQSSYTKSDYEIDLNTGWLMTFLEHTYFLVPLCIHVMFPFCHLDICHQVAIKSAASVYFLNLNVSEQLLIMIPSSLIGIICMWFTLRHTSTYSTKS